MIVICVKTKLIISDKMMVIDQRILTIISKIEALNYDIVIIGGFVRDHLLGIPSNDYDLATNAPLSLVLELFINSKPIYVDDNLTMIELDYEGIKVEISQYRKESYSDDYKVLYAEYTDDLKEDVLRRDITINALAYNGGIIDYVDGLKDIDDKIIRVIGDPRERFKEDPLRILRCLRFASTHDLTIEKKTLEAIKEMYQSAITVNNSEFELKKILKGKNFDYVYHVIPELFDFITMGHFSNVSLKNREVLQEDIGLLVYLIYEVNLSETNVIFDFLSFSKKDLDFVSSISIALDDLMSYELTYEEVVPLFIYFGKDTMMKIYKYFKGFDYLNEHSLNLIKEVSEKSYIRIDELEININDIPYDVSIKEKYNILKEIQLLIVQGKLKNKRESLLDIIYNDYD